MTTTTFYWWLLLAILGVFYVRSARCGASLGERLVAYFWLASAFVGWHYFIQPWNAVIGNVVITAIALWLSRPPMATDNHDSFNHPSFAFKLATRIFVLLLPLVVALVAFLIPEPVQLTGQLPFWEFLRHPTGKHLAILCYGIPMSIALAERTLHASIWKPGSAACRRLRVTSRCLLGFGVINVAGLADWLVLDANGFQLISNERAILLVMIQLLFIAGLAFGFPSRIAVPVVGCSLPLFFGDLLWSWYDVKDANALVVSARIIVWAVAIIAWDVYDQHVLQKIAANVTPESVRRSISD